MARNLRGFLVLIAAALIYSASFSSAASVFQPISDSHRSAALDIFSSPDGSFASLEQTYEAIRSFEVLGIDKKPEAACRSVKETLASASADSKDLFYALKVNRVLKCKTVGAALEGIISRLQAAVGGASSLYEFYYSIGSLVLVKDQTSKQDLYLSDAEGVFRSIKALSQSDGRWRYNSNNPESSTFAAGLALEALAGVVSLASSEIDQSLIGTTKNDILKLFDSIEKYDDGSFYFDEKVLGAREHQGPLSTTSCIVRGLTAFAAVTSGSLNIPEDKILGLARFFLGIGIPGDSKDFFNQIDSLACLENNRQLFFLTCPFFGHSASVIFYPCDNRSLVIEYGLGGVWGWLIEKYTLCYTAFREATNPVFIPLILSLPATVLSLTKKDTLKVKVNTVLGSNAPALTVKLVRVSKSGSKDTAISGSQELKFDPQSTVYTLDILPNNLDVGKYIFVFEVILHDPEHKNLYATGSQTRVPIFITGLIRVDNAEITVLDSDLGSIETQKKLDIAQQNLVSFSANHLQKLRLSFQLTTPLGHSFKPHQVCPCLLL
ncbi:hypothetical protein Tsubulata_028303 [Turnera subulata]|uniref:Dolichyl-diphosphooligosaccharide--protein glycosyltransferase subunit 2 n=1 Tax=Turnera subulata TaxID=218843 RepID=A0A9Q0FMU0_9ROSI|nr:hypothetical protein Tsubulata_028303 [Turnera subulata]